MRRRSTAVASVLAALTLVGAIHTSAFAGGHTTRSFATSGNPLISPNYNNGTARAYGSVSVPDTSDGTKFRVSSNQRVRTDSGDHDVRARAEFQTNAGVCVAPDYTSCSQPWYGYKAIYTSQTNSRNYVVRTAQIGADGRADTMRGRVRVEMVVRLRPDPVSGYRLTKGINY